MANWPANGDTAWNTAMLAYLAVEHETDGTHKAFSTFLGLGTPTELTINGSGAITATKSFHTVDTNSDDASDNLDTINGGVEGNILVLRAQASGRTVVIRDNVGNIKVSAAGTSFSLTHVEDIAAFIFNGSKWLAIALQNNTA